MEAKEIKNVEYLRKLVNKYLDISKEADNKADCSIEIKFVNYYELGCTITDMLKLCILALNQETPRTSEKVENPSINVALILEVVLKMFPINEFELLTEISELVSADSL
ncbi:hypothetical protein ACQKCJ_04485 [Flavobacterium sp. NPDC079362]|uniref:hypothetical protein n=1 Tax=Flavobacterium sp. NPDC079362 TaxID=3390566 RepID=UPI003D040EEA